MQYLYIICNWLAPVAKPKQDWFVKTTLLEGVRDKRTEKKHDSKILRPPIVPVGNLQWVFGCDECGGKSDDYNYMSRNSLNTTSPYYVIYIFLYVQYIS